MTISENYILNKKSVLLDFDRAPEDIRAGLSGKAVTYILTRPSARGGAIALDEMGGAFVRLFTGGATLPSALKAVSQRFEIGTEEVVKLAYPLIKKLITEQHILTEAQVKDETRSSQGIAEPNITEFRGMKISGRLQQLDDTAVYVVELPEGGQAALKLMLQYHEGHLNSFKRETEILKHLNGMNAPRLLDAELEGKDSFILMEMIKGSHLLQWAEQMRGLPKAKRYREFLRVGIDILRAYKELHSLGVIHGDLWSKNIIVEHTGGVRLLDFGISWYPSANEKFGEPPRFTHVFFRAPDLAEAELKGETPPPPSVLSDVYGLGVVLYLMLTGKHYIDFSIEKEAQIRDVCEKPMRTFSELGLPGWPAMEALLSRMLEKDPANRPPSVEMCLELLKDVEIPNEVEETRSLQEAGDSIKYLRALAGADAPPTIPAPTASVFFGLSGTGLAMLRAGFAERDSSLMAEAEYLVSYSRKWMLESEEGAYAPARGISKNEVGTCGVMHHIHGVSLVEAILAHTTGDARTLRRACNVILETPSLSEMPLEFCFGRAGILQAIQQLSLLVVDKARLIEKGNALATEMLLEIEAFSSLERSPVQFLGFAHGWAGIVYSLVAWARLYNAPLMERIQPLLDQLGRYRIDSPLGAHWPRRFDEAPAAGDHPSWCTGTGGFVYLWTEAYIATGDQKWLNLATDAALMTALHSNEDYNLCCGLAGRAYALARMYQATGQRDWIDRAKTCLDRAKTGASYFEHSLFKGIPGLELARVEIKAPETMVMPMLATSYGAPLAV